MEVPAEAPTITALRQRASGRVAVELDGRQWRVLPVEAIVRTGLDVGVALDRERLRALRRELRSRGATDAALRALGRREHTVASLDARLARSGFDEVERGRTVERLRSSGLVDDRRFAVQRATQLAGREAGDRMILADLLSHGVSGDVAAAALAELEPEGERAARVVARLGTHPRAVRRLASRGFADETLEPLIAELGDGTVR